MRPETDSANGLIYSCRHPVAAPSRRPRLQTVEQAASDAVPPCLSILLPFRNAAATLPECLLSIQRQSLTNYELLAVDDHSSDASRSLLQQVAARDSRIRLLSNPGQGLVSALNHGLQRAATPLIARMDADDRMHPERLRLQYRYLQRHHEIALLGCATRIFPTHGLRAGIREYVRWQNGCNGPRQIADEIYIESPFAHPSVMFRRAPVMRLGGYREGLFPEDYDLWLRLHRAGVGMAKLPQTLLDWRDYPERTSRVDPRCSRAAFDALRARYLAKDPRVLRRSGRLVFWGAGRKTRKRCNLLIEKGLKPSAWVDIDPKKIGNRLNGVAVESPAWLSGLQPRPLVLVYVTNHGARERIARDLEWMGYRRGRDYLAVG